MDWRWRFLDSDGRGLSPIGMRVGTEAEPLRDGFATQADADTWIGEVWRELVEQDVASVELWCGDSLVYGPMELSA